MTPPKQTTDALEEFDRFYRFIDGMHMGGFVENDFMSKAIQNKIRTALIQAGKAEKLWGGLHGLIHQIQINDYQDSVGHKLKMNVRYELALEELKQWKETR